MEAKLLQLGDITVGTVPLGALVQRRTNYRKMNDQAFRTLQASVQKFGFRSFIVVVPGKEENTYEVIDGHHRWAVARDLKMEQVPVVVLDKADQDGADLAMLSFNVTADILPDVYLDFLKELDTRVGSDTLSQFTALDVDFLKDLSATIDMPDLVPENSGDTDRSRGMAIMIALPRTPQIEKMLAWAQSHYGVGTPSDAVVEALREACRGLLNLEDA